MKRYTDLQFIIGIFFLIISLILLVDYFLNQPHTGRLNLYTGLVFFIFGISMALFRAKEKEE